MSESFGMPLGETQINAAANSDSASAKNYSSFRINRHIPARRETFLAKDELGVDQWLRSRRPFGNARLPRALTRRRGCCETIHGNVREVHVICRHVGPVTNIRHRLARRQDIAQRY